MTDQWEYFKIKTLLYILIYFFGIFLLFFIIKIVFLSFSFLFLMESNFRNRILTNQKHELVVSNWQRNSMKEGSIGFSSLTKEIEVTAICNKK